MKIKVLGRRQPSTEYYYDLFEKIARSLPDNFECYYVWVWTDSIDKLLKINFKKSNILIFCTDAWIWEEMASFNERTQFARDLIILADRYPKINFYVCGELFYGGKEFIGIKNVKFLENIIPPIMQEKEELNQLDPVFDKNFNSEKTSVILTRGERRSRTNILSYLFGINLGKNTKISYNTSNLQKFNSWFDYCPWPLDNITDDQKNNICNGFKLLQQYKESDVESLNGINKIYRSDISAANSLNFRLHLTKIYQNSFVELVAETTFAEKSVHLSEKTSHSMFACNFPIIFSGVGAIKHLREFIGFDMFDDVIDHSYDNIEDPMKRMVTAIDLNYEILSNGDLAKELWIKHKDRFHTNIEIFRNQMAKKYEDNISHVLEKEIK